jgi:hypothetical protein
MANGFIKQSQHCALANGCVALHSRMSLETLDQQKQRCFSVSSENVMINVTGRCFPGTTPMHDLAERGRRFPALTIVAVVHLLPATIAELSGRARH